MDIDSGEKQERRIRFLKSKLKEAHQKSEGREKAGGRDLNHIS